jgi:D-3-phosphoglycerate dehydrogenase
MVYVVNEDAPGFIGGLGTLLGGGGVNIGTFHLGRRSAGGEAVLLLSIDEALTPELLAQVRALPGVVTAMGLAF